MYNLSGNLTISDFTLLLPTDDAIRQYFSRTNSSTLVGSDYMNLISFIILRARKGKFICRALTKKLSVLHI